METTNSPAEYYIPNVILQQLGGQARLNAFLGVSNLFLSEYSLGFRFKAKGAKGINLVTVRLDPSDTYTVLFHRVNKNGAKLVQEFNDVYCDDLVECVEQTTGLYLHF
jgi:hypothetical protein